MKITDITPDNARNFIEGNLNKLLSRYDKLPNHVMEQALYRAYLCYSCLKTGKCVYTDKQGRVRGCGCPTPNLFFAPKKVDSKKLWGPMLDAEEWEKFKSDNNEYSDIVKSERYRKVVDIFSNKK